ncbi:putative cytochrome P450 E-class, group I [Rhypophila decipiens]|uniref:Cytochrome P450 E-class, group I n=1 Tax=Rhypophila decipiens TaxID=261697 RepID=A0AAN6Y413_9PEZI|nr:putative cytochrome P450 E-class, group I [Rhypophila decipiens]
MELTSSLLSWQSIALTAVLYFSTLAFYRLYLHPLAKFPGPKLAAITRYYEAYYDIIKNGQYTFKIADMHKKYGPIIRISPYELHINDPSYFEKLYCHSGGKWNKYDWAVDAQCAIGAIIFTPDHDRHKARRLPLNAYFSKANIFRHKDLIVAKVDKLCSRIAEFSGTGRIIDLGAAISAFQRDVSTEFVLGKDYKNLDQDDFGVGMTLVFHGGGAMWRLTKHIRWYGPAMLAIPKDFLIKNAGPNTANFMRYAQDSEHETARLLEAAATYKPGGDDGQRRTIVHEIFDSDLLEEDKSVARVFADVATVTGAGFETTASVLRLIVYHVFSNPAILGRLRDELAHATSGSDDGSSTLPLQTLEQLPYLTAVLMEGMRLSPALATRLQRIAPDRELIYDRYRIPAGTPVGMTTLLMHMDERLYPEPHRFEPERWVDPEARKKTEKTYAPFSRGTRICLGMHLAWAEVYLVMAALLQKFDFDFEGLTHEDHFEVMSDQFIISTKGKAVLQACVSHRMA